MTAASAPAGTRPPGRMPALPLPVSGRLLRLELRHNAMLWLLPLVGALFWYNGYREIMALPPLWNLRAMTLQNRLLFDLVVPVTAAAAWTGSREGRRDVTDLLGVTARPHWSRQLTAWAATTAWAELGCLGCVAVVYGMTARQATWGGPLWWPVAVSVAGVPALTAIGFAAGATFPGRFVTPVATVAVFFGFAYGTQAASGDHSYWQISPLTSGAVDIGAAPGVATFYRYLPDLSIAQLMFTAGLTAAVLGGLGVSAARNGPRLRAFTAALAAAGLALAVTATALAGTGRLDAHGMIVIPALHDPASGRAISYTPRCSRTAIAVCVHPAYEAFLPAVTAAIAPELAELAGLPGAPARISQVPELYRQGPDNSIVTFAETRGRSEFALPDRVPGQPDATSAEFASQLIQSVGLQLVSGVVLGSSRSAGPNPGPAELAVIGGSVRFPPSVENRDLAPLFGRLLPVPGSPAELAARRFAELTPAARHDWLAHHLTALRAGRISLGQLP